MFSNLFGGNSAKIDAREWHPDIDTALGLFTARDWTPLSLLVARQTPSAAFKLVTALGERSELDSDLGETPQTPVLNAILGGVATAWAWRHRGFGSADDVAEDRWPRFFDALARAHNHLQAALELRENDGLALGFMGRVATGQQDEDLLDDVETRFMAISDKSMDACAMFLQARAAKWGGSHEAMYAHAQSFVADENLHPARLSLYARAHVERWLYDSFMDEDPNVNTQGRKLTGDAQFIADIRQINDEYAALLEGNKSAQDDWAACTFAHNNLGFALYLTHQMPQASAHVEALGAKPATWPWVYALGDPIETEWKRLRKSVGLSAQVKSKP